MENRGHSTIARKRRAVKINEYRRVTLLSTAYKVYASILANRLGREVEEKRIIPDWDSEKEKG